MAGGCAILNFMLGPHARPGWKMNKLMIGKTLLKLGRTTEAKLALQDVLQMPSVTAEDATCHAEAQALV